MQTEYLTGDLVTKRPFTLPSIGKVFFFSTLLSLIILIFLWRGVAYLNTPSPDFPTDVDVTIVEGMTVRDVADAFADASVVRSSFLLYMRLILYHESEYIKAATYHFTEPLTNAEIAEAITKGLYVSPSIKVTFPEGYRARDLIELLPDIVTDTDLSTLEKQEGFLFPDTYYITNDMTVIELVELLRANYDTRLEPYRPLIESSTLSEYEVITLASIVEREANDEASMRLVAGILLNRLKSGMPLQVDAAFEYILGKTSEELTMDDLALDSPYNTYENVGLPPTPISNPGLMSIEAVLEPQPSEYLYYLTGNDGKFYYAVTFEEHKLNKARYLK